jgi:hypothetical protein
MDSFLTFEEAARQAGGEPLRTFFVNQTTDYVDTGRPVIASYPDGLYHLLGFVRMADHGVGHFTIPADLSRWLNTVLSSEDADEFRRLFIRVESYRLLEALGDTESNLYTSLWNTRMEDRECLTELWMIGQDPLQARTARMSFDDLPNIRTWPKQVGAGRVPVDPLEIQYREDGGSTVEIRYEWLTPPTGIGRHHITVVVGQDVWERDDVGAFIRAGLEWAVQYRVDATHPREMLSVVREAWVQLASEVAPYESYGLGPDLAAYDSYHSSAVRFRQRIRDRTSADRETPPASVRISDEIERLVTRTTADSRQRQRVQEVLAQVGRNDQRRGEYRHRHCMARQDALGYLQRLGADYEPLRTYIKKHAMKTPIFDALDVGVQLRVARIHPSPMVREILAEIVNLRLSQSVSIVERQAMLRVSQLTKLPFSELGTAPIDIAIAVLWGMEASRGDEAFQQNGEFFDPTLPAPVSEEPAATTTEEETEAPVQAATPAPSDTIAAVVEDEVQPEPSENQPHFYAGLGRDESTYTHLKENVLVPSDTKLARRIDRAVHPLGLSDQQASWAEELLAQGAVGRLPATEVVAHLQEAVGLSKEAARRVAKDFKFDLSVLKPQLNPEEFPIPSIRATLEQLAAGNIDRRDASIILQALKFPQTGQGKGQTKEARRREARRLVGLVMEDGTETEDSHDARPEMPELPDKVCDAILVLAWEARENSLDDNQFYRLLGALVQYLIDSGITREALLKSELDCLRSGDSRSNVFGFALSAYGASKTELKKFVWSIARIDGLDLGLVLNSTRGLLDLGRLFESYLPKEMRADIRRERGGHGPIIGHGFGPDELRDPNRTPITPAENVPEFTKVLKDLQDTLQMNWLYRFTSLASVAQEGTPVAELLTGCIGTIDADLRSVLEAFRFRLNRGGVIESGTTPAVYVSRERYHFGFGLTFRLALADVFFNEQHSFYNKRGAAGFFLVEEAAFHELVHAVLGAEGEQDEVVHELAIRWQAVLYWRLDPETVASLDLEALEHHDANCLGRALRYELKQRAIDTAIADALEAYDASYLFAELEPMLRAWVLDQRDELDTLEWVAQELYDPTRAISHVPSRGHPGTPGKALSLTALIMKDLREQLEGVATPTAFPVIGDLALATDQERGEPLYRHLQALAADDRRARMLLSAIDASIYASDLLDRADGLGGYRNLQIHFAELSLGRSTVASVVPMLQGSGGFRDVPRGAAGAGDDAAVIAFRQHYAPLKVLYALRTQLSLIRDEGKSRGDGRTAPGAHPVGEEHASAQELQDLEQYAEKVMKAREVTKVERDALAEAWNWQIESSRRAQNLTWRTLEWHLRDLALTLSRFLRSPPDQHTVTIGNQEYRVILKTTDYPGPYRANRSGRAFAAFARQDDDAHTLTLYIRRAINTNSPRLGPAIHELAEQVIFRRYSSSLPPGMTADQFHTVAFILEGVADAVMFDTLSLDVSPSLTGDDSPPLLSIPRRAVEEIGAMSTQALEQFIESSEAQRQQVDERFSGQRESWEFLAWPAMMRANTLGIIAGLHAVAQFVQARARVIAAAEREYEEWNKTRGYTVKKRDTIPEYRELGRARGALMTARRALVGVAGEAAVEQVERIWAAATAQAGSVASPERNRLEASLTTVDTWQHGVNAESSRRFGGPVQQGTGTVRDILLAIQAEHPAYRLGLWSVWRDEEHPRGGFYEPVRMDDRVMPQWTVTREQGGGLRVAFQGLIERDGTWHVAVDGEVFLRPRGDRDTRWQPPHPEGQARRMQIARERAEAVQFTEPESMHWPLLGDVFEYEIPKWPPTEGGAVALHQTADPFIPELSTVDWMGAAAAHSARGIWVGAGLALRFSEIQSLPLHTASGPWHFKSTVMQVQNRWGKAMGDVPESIWMWVTLGVEVADHAGNVVIRGRIRRAAPIPQLPKAEQAKLNAVLDPLQEPDLAGDLALFLLGERNPQETLAALTSKVGTEQANDLLARIADGGSKQTSIADSFTQLRRDAEEYEVVAGVPKGVYEALKKEDKDGFTVWENGLKKEQNIRLVAIEADEEEAQIEELERNIGSGKVVAALLDVDENIERREIDEILINLKERTVRDIIELTNPELSTLTQEKIKKIDVEEMRNILALLIRTLPQGASYRLSEKSIYDIRIKNVYDMHHEKYSQQLEKYLLKDIGENKPDIMVSAVDNALDMKVLAEAIRERRAKVPKGQKDPITDYVIVSSKVFDEVVPAGSREARLQGIKAFLGETGLDEIRGDKNVIILGEEEARDLTPEGVLEIIAGKERIPIDDEDMMKNLRKRTAIGQKSMIITVDSETPDELFKGENGLVFVQQDPGKGIASQMYRIMLEIRANNGRRPSAVVGTLVQINNSRMFTYTPDIEPIDLKEEIRAYERYVREVLVRA